MIDFIDLTASSNTLPKLSSFIIGGFESTYALRKDGTRFDLLKDTHHDRCLQQDYQLLKSIGIKTVRESLSWSQIDKKGEYEFDRFEAMMAAARNQGIQQLWSLNHFDFPENLDPFSERFVTRFVAYALAAVEKIIYYQGTGAYLNLINEPSFFAYIGGQVGGWAPFKIGRKNADALKYQLIRAEIAGAKAIRQNYPKIKLIHIDPIMRRIPYPPITSGKMRIYEDFESVKYSGFDLVAGYSHPEFGGRIEYLDVIGVNYYSHNQEWINRNTFQEDQFIRQPLALNDPRRISFAHMLWEIYQRFHRPIIVTETGSHGTLRYNWWRKLLTEIDDAIDMGIPVAGICAYPVIDRPDWFKGHLTNSGLWDFRSNDPACQRIPHRQTIAIIQRYLDKKKEDNSSDSLFGRPALA